MNKCIVCKKEIPWDQRCLNGTKGSICMGCEFKKIDVWHIMLPGETQNGYYDTDIGHVLDMLSECDYGEGYDIRKIRMRAMKYYSLPEFVGF